MALDSPDLLEIEPPVKKRSRFWTRAMANRFLFISIAVHLILGLGATAFVVQRYQANRKLTFKGGPPSPNRSTRSIEHKVQMAKKQQTMSAPAIKRVVSTGLSKVTLPEMPAMPKADAAPAKMAGAGGTGIGMSSAMNAASGAQSGGGLVSLFGLREATGGALVGTFYDLKQNPGRQKADGKVNDVVTEFVNGNWNEGILGKYFRGPSPLYASQILTPVIEADEGPKAFKLETMVKPGRWLVLYRGRVSPPESGTYHFVGAGDDIMMVRFGGGGIDPHVVLDRSYNLHKNFGKTLAQYHYDFPFPDGFGKGDALNLNAGTFYDIDILIGEDPGGKFFAALLFEKEGATYEKDSRGNPILPPFRIANVKAPEGNPGEKVPPLLADGPIWRAEKVRK